jgi:HK97 gp10 family phage protein
MKTVSVKWSGVKEMEQMLKDLGPRIASRLGGRAAKAGAKPIIKMAKALVPKKTGELKRSIVAQKERAKGGAYAATQTVLIGFRPPASRRAHLVEFGTSHSSAKPFMRPALDAQHQAALDRMREVLAQGIQKEEYKRATAPEALYDIFTDETPDEV